MVFWSVILVLAGPVSAYDVSSTERVAAESLDLTLQDAIVVALQNGHSLIQARLRRAIERYELKIAESAFQPRIVTQAYARQRDDYTTKTENSGLDTSLRLRIPTGGEFALISNITRDGDEDPSGHNNDGTLELIFKQPLLRGAGFNASLSGLRSARNNEEINILSFKSEIISLTSQVIRAYRDHVQANTRVDIAQRSLDRALDLLEINQLLVATGRMAEQDVVQTQADIARRELDLLASQGRLDASRLELINVLDIKTDMYFGNLDELVLHDFNNELIDPIQRTEIAFRQRPDYLQAGLRIENARNRHVTARSNRLWDLSLTLGRSFRGELDELTDSSQRVSLELDIPIGRAAAGPSKLQERRALADLKIAQSELNELRQQIEISVKNSVRDVELAYQGAEIAGKARELAAQKAEIEREKLSLGVTTNFQLVTFENDLVLAEISELNAIADYLNSVTRLDQVTGNVLNRWEIDVERVESMTQTPMRFETSVE